MQREQSAYSDETMQVEDFLSAFEAEVSDEEEWISEAMDHSTNQRRGRFSFSGLNA